MGMVEKTTHFNDINSIDRFQVLQNMPIEKNQLVPK